MSCLTTALVIANTSALTAVVPEIARDLAASQSQVQWIGDSYPLVLAALLLPAGALLDRYGRKRGLLAGLVVLGAALVWSGLSDSAAWLIASRCAAGVGAALVFPATLATITATFPPERRGRAVGMWAASATVGGILGVLLAGALSQVAWWGSSLFFLAGVALVCLATAVLFTPETSDPGHANLDPLGCLLSVAAVGALVYAVTEGPVHGWTDGIVLAAATGGGISAVAFAAWEGHAARPLLDLRRFADPAVASSSVAIFLTFLALYGVLFLAFQYFAFILGYDAFGSALRMVPFGLGVLASAPFAPAMARHAGRRVVISAGLWITAVALVGLGLAGDSASYTALVVPITVLGIGIGLAATPPTEAILEALPPAQQGVASAINDAAREMGAAVGIAVLGSAFNTGYRSTLGGTLTNLPGVLRDAVTTSPSVGSEVLRRIDPALARTLSASIREALIDGWRLALIVGAFLLAIGAAYVQHQFPRRAAAISADEARAAAKAQV